MSAAAAAFAAGRGAGGARLVAAGALLAAYTASLAGAARAAAREPTAANVQRVVGAGVLGLLPLQAVHARRLGGNGGRRRRGRCLAACPAARAEAGCDVSLRLAYVTNGLGHHRLDDALALLADSGYDGVALTLDHLPPRPVRAATCAPA